MADGGPASEYQLGVGEKILKKQVQREKKRHDKLQRIITKIKESGDTEGDLKHGTETHYLRWHSGRVRSAAGGGGAQPQSEAAERHRQRQLTQTVYLPAPVPGQVVPPVPVAACMPPTAEEMLFVLEKNEARVIEDLNRPAASAPQWNAHAPVPQLVGRSCHFTDDRTVMNTVETMITCSPIIGEKLRWRKMHKDARPTKSSDASMSDSRSRSRSSLNERQYASTKQRSPNAPGGTVHFANILVFKRDTYARTKSPLPRGASTAQRDLRKRWDEQKATFKQMQGIKKKADEQKKKSDASPSKSDANRGRRK